MAVLGASWAVLRPSWAVLGPSWGPLGLSWGDLGGPLGRLRRCQDEKDEYAKIVRFPMGMGRFLFLGVLSAVLWEHSWAVLGASWAVLKPSWTVAGLPWAVSTLSSTVLALCLGSLGPSWSFLEAPEAPGRRLGARTPPPLKRDFGPPGRGKGGGGQPNVSHAFSPPASGGRRIDRSDNTMLGLPRGVGLERRSGILSLAKMLVA